MTPAPCQTGTSQAQQDCLNHYLDTGHSNGTLIVWALIVAVVAVAAIVGCWQWQRRRGA